MYRVRLHESEKRKKGEIEKKKRERRERKRKRKNIKIGKESLEQRFKEILVLFKYYYCALQ